MDPNINFIDDFVDVKFNRKIHIFVIILCEEFLNPIIHNIEMSPFKSVYAHKLCSMHLIVLNTSSTQYLLQKRD